MIVNKVYKRQLSVLTVVRRAHVRTGVQHADSELFGVCVTDLTFVSDLLGDEVFETVSWVRLENQLHLGGEHGGPETVFVNTVTQVLEFTVVVGSLDCSELLSGHLRS